MQSSPFCSLDTHSNPPALLLKGDWTITNLKALQQIDLAEPLSQNSEIDCKELRRLDTAAAALLLNKLGSKAHKLQLNNCKEQHRNIFELVSSRMIDVIDSQTSIELGLLARIGKTSLQVWNGIKELINFIGQTCAQLFQIILKPRLLRSRELAVQLENACLDAIPIVSLVTFLIGLVIAYLYASQMQKFGANIFIVDSVAVAMCRELSPLIVAIIMAGRSGSAYTAQIGTMKLNEEVDALLTLGLSPMRVLVIPRVLALMLAMPLLVFVGDLVGTAAGFFIADLYLGITPTTFLERLHSIMQLKTLLVGLVKAPVFAALIAIIGCQMGLNVENNARSVGLHTTSTVVQSIVAVILLNAAFAVIFVELGI